MSATTPRVNGAMLSEYKGRTVRLTAKIVKLSGETAMVESSDGMQIHLLLNRDAHLSETYCEVIGKVQDDLGIKVLWSIDMGDNLDMTVVDSVTKMQAAAMHNPDTSIF